MVLNMPLLLSPFSLLTFTCSKLTIKTPERPEPERVFIANFEHIPHLFLVFLLFTLNKYMLAGLSPILFLHISHFFGLTVASFSE